MEADWRTRWSERAHQSQFTTLDWKARCPMRKVIGVWKDDLDFMENFWFNWELRAGFVKGMILALDCRWWCFKLLNDCIGMDQCWKVVVVVKRAAIVVNKKVFVADKEVVSSLIVRWTRSVVR